MLMARFTHNLCQAATCVARPLFFVPFVFLLRRPSSPASPIEDEPVLDSPHLQLSFVGELARVPPAAILLPARAATVVALSAKARRD
jgi:hypothetical protein